MRQVNRYRYFRPLLLTALLSAAFVSCSKEDREPQVQREGVELRLTAAVDNSFGQAQDATKSPVLGTNLPAGTHLLSIAIFKSDKTTAWGTGYDNVKAEVNVNNYGAQTWRFQLKGSTEWRNFLSFPEGTTGDMWITALYPYNASATLAAGATIQYTVDLTTTAQQASQDDVMYAEPQKLTLAAGDRSKALLLSFKHAFALFEFQIAPIFNDPCKITKVALSNGTAENWVSNKGNLLSSGTYTSTANGEVAVTDSRTMTMGTYNSYSVMIPVSSLALSNYDDGDITVYFTEGLNSAIAPSPLPIKKEWLVAAGGLKQGYRYTFKMVYHNSSTGTGGMTVTGWTVNGEQEDNWGVPSDFRVPSEGYIYFSHPAVISSGKFLTDVNDVIYTITKSTSTSYNSYQTGANADNNGGYKKDMAAVLLELPYHKFEVAKTDETPAANWAGAWASCKAKAPAGQWRLPRQTELMLMYLNKEELEKTPGFSAFTTTYNWVGTEYSSIGSWYVDLSDGYSDNYAKEMPTYATRCIREVSDK